VRYGAAFGEPLTVRKDLEKREAQKVFLDELRERYLRLHEELKVSMPPGPAAQAGQ
jgi:hypothetical protein